MHLVWQEHWQRASALNSCNKSGFMKLSVTLFTLIILISIAWNFQYIERQGCRVVAWGGEGGGCLDRRPELTYLYDMVSLIVLPPVLLFG